MRELFEKMLLNIKIINLILKIKCSFNKKHNTYLLWDCLTDSNVECIDAFTLFQYLLNNKKDAYYVLLKDSPLYQKLYSENMMKNIIVLNNTITAKPLEFLKATKNILSESKYLLTSFTENNSLTKLFFRKEKRFKYVFLQHGVSYFKESVFLKKYIKKKNFNKCLITSTIEKKIFNKYGIKDKQIILSGFPRWDLLNNKISLRSEKSIFVMFTYRSFNNKIEESLYYKNILNLFKNEELINYLIQYDINLFFAPHHKIINKLSQITENLSCIQIVPQDKISYYIKNSSMLLTDFSSIVFDFMFQNKPVVLYGLDSGDKNLSKYDKFDLDNLIQKKESFPNIFFKEEDIINCIKKYIDNNFKIDEDTRKIYNEFFIVRENICKHLVETLENLKR